MSEANGKTSSRIYAVRDQAHPDDVKLIRATNQAQAIKHASPSLVAEVATPDELVVLIGSGHQVIDATAKPKVE